MALRIANNIAAMNTQRWLSVADSGMKKSLEKLSSGYRINKAADDAAGLAISQSFRAEIASFKVASRNTSEANAMLQVAEGGMDQISNMLTRLRELATQAASDNVTSSERTKINSEASHLILEMDRIADSTKYGSTTLLNGSFGGVSDGGHSNVITDGFVDSSDSYKVYQYTDGGSNSATVTFSGSPGLQAGTFTLNQSGAAGGIITLNNGSLSVTATLSGTTLAFDEIGMTLSYASTTTTTQIGNDSFTVEANGSGLSSTSFSVGSSATATTYTLDAGSGGVTLKNSSTSQAFTGLSDGAQTLDFSTLGIKLTLDSNFDTSDASLNGMLYTVSSGGTKTFQIGAENNTDNRLSVTINDTTTGASGLNVASLTLDTQANARTAIDTLTTAISTLATRRGDVGAYMNRLSYAAANLNSTIENVQAAESVIRDVDMASEMTNFTKNQILLQAGTAMLAQANMAPQQVLSLFG